MLITKLTAIIKRKFKSMRTDKSTTGNSTFEIGGVSCSADSFVVIESLVFRINIYGENPAHRKSAKRYVQP